MLGECFGLVPFISLGSCLFLNGKEMKSEIERKPREDEGHEGKQLHISKLLHRALRVVWARSPHFGLFFRISNDKDGNRNDIEGKSKEQEGHEGKQWNC